MKKFWLISALILAVRTVNGEEAPLHPPIDSIAIAPITQEKVFLYGSLSLAPGIGVSDRSRIASKGNALDYKVGIAFVPIDSVEAIPVLSIDYNFFHFFRSDEPISPYVSYGIGAIYFIPYVPLRAGIQFDSGFFDIGAKMLMGFIPAPELRGGINLKF